MRDRPTWRRLVRVEFTRCRLRPVLGRLPLLGGGVAGAIALAARPATTSIEVEAMSGAIAIASTPALLVAFVVGAGIAHDHRASGIDATDRAMVGQPTALGLAQLVALASWIALVATAVAGALVLAAMLTGASRGQRLPPPADLWPIAASTLQFSVAAGLTAAVGFALSRAGRSTSAAIGGFLLMLLLGDGVLVSLHLHLALLAIPDNLLALGSGRLEGLAVRGESFAASATRAVLATIVVAAAATVFDARRDVL